MKAVRVHRFGLETPMRLEEVESPAPGGGKLLLRRGRGGDEAFE